jgi:hypothetical protein
MKCDLELVKFSFPGLPCQSLVLVQSASRQVKLGCSHSIWDQSSVELELLQTRQRCAFANLLAPDSPEPYSDNTVPMQYALVQCCTTVLLYY